MKIGIDIRCLAQGKRSGVEEYTLGLLQELFKLDTRNEYVLFLNSFKRPRIDLGGLLSYPNVKLKLLRFPNKLLNFCFWYLGWPHADKLIGGVDVFFMPNIQFIALSSKAKLVLTMHDLSFEILPHTFSFKRRLWHMFVSPRRLAKKADLVVAISDSTRADILARYGLAPEKVVRIYNGVAESFGPIDRNDPRLLAVKEKYRLPFSFILSLSTIEPRKNIESLASAFDVFKKTALPAEERTKLVIAGAKGWKTRAIFDKLRRAKYTDDILYIGAVADEDKPYVYNLASLFVYPSHLEGFGLPVLEAMKCAVPVVSSHTSSLGEVVGGGGILVDPDRPDELAQAMRQLLKDKDLQANLAEAQRWQAFRFSWRQSAREFLDAIAKIM
ncbi:MAG TPA: glycosyltransferase family 1 protein [Candidatus Moranbacteria bacterium]|nr:glycosyltransferase family 1 protein [Candidatus Moranbacteria bacterium]